MTKTIPRARPESPSAGVNHLVNIQRASIAFTALTEAARLIALAKAEIDEMPARDSDWEFLNDPGEYGWWSDTHTALKTVKKWAKKLRRRMYP